MRYLGTCKNNNEGKINHMAAEATIPSWVFYTDIFISFAVFVSAGATAYMAFKTHRSAKATEHSSDAMERSVQATQESAQATQNMAENTEESNRLAVRPHLQVNSEVGDNEVKFYVYNSGNGPAIIEDIFFYKG